MKIRRDSPVLSTVPFLLSLILSSCSSDTKSTTPPAKPDLKVPAILFKPLSPSVGLPETISVVVENAGPGQAAATLTRVTVDSAATCAAIPTRLLAAGQRDTVRCVIAALPSGDHPVEACADATGLLDEASETNNCGTRILASVPRPNLLPHGIFFTPERPDAGEPFSISAILMNNGTLDAPANDVRIKLDRVAWALQAPALAVGMTDTVVWNAPGRDDGSHVIEVCADYLSQIDESNEGDNCLERILDVGPPSPMPDLVASAVYFEPPLPHPGQTILVRVVVTNAGSAAAPETLTRVRIDGVYPCADIETRLLQAGDGDTVTCNLGYRIPGAHPVEACVDATGLAVESEERNNCSTDTLRVQP